MSKLTDAFLKRKITPYPEARSDYTENVAKAGEITYRFVVRDLGLDAEPHLIQHHGADIITENSDIGMEVWNWCAPHCYEEREESVKENLKPFKNKLLLPSFISDSVSYRITMIYKDNPIDVVELGFQILPNDYLGWATSNRITYGVRFCNKRTEKIMRNRLLSNSKIRDALAKTKNVTQSTKRIETEDNSCYVYTSISSNPLVSKISSSRFVLDVFSKCRRYFEGLKVKFRLSYVFSKVKPSEKARFSASKNEVLPYD